MATAALLQKIDKSTCPLCGEQYLFPFVVEGKDGMVDSHCPKCGEKMGSVHWSQLPPLTNIRNSIWAVSGGDTRLIQSCKILVKWIEKTDPFRNYIQHCNLLLKITKMIHGAQNS